MGTASKKAKAIRAKYDHESYEWYKSHGICPRCKKQYNKPGRVHCEACLAELLRKKWKRDPTGEIKRQRDKERRQEAQEKGLCTVCKKRKPPDGRLECEVCRQRKRDSQKKIRIHQRILKMQNGIIAPEIGTEGRHFNKG